MSHDVLVAGVGNIFLGDDGFGCEVARLLERESLPEGVVAKDYGIGGLHLAYEVADGVGTLILIDAIAYGDEPGEVNVLEADTDAGASCAFDAHSMDPVSVLNSVRNLGVEPPRTLIVGCKPACLEDGIGLSPVVASAVEPAMRVVLELIERESTTKEC